SSHSLRSLSPAVLYSLSLHDALPICSRIEAIRRGGRRRHPSEHRQPTEGVYPSLLRDGAAAYGGERCRRTAVWRDRDTRALLHRSEEHTSELQSRSDIVCRLLLEKKK